MIIRFLKWLFRRKTKWDSFNYGKPATVEDELSRLNNER